MTVSTIANANPRDGLDMGADYQPASYAVFTRFDAEAHLLSETSAERHFLDGAHGRVTAPAASPVAQALLFLPFMARAASVAAKVNPRPAWDAPARSAAQERFFREVMTQDTLPSAPEIAQRL